MPAGKMPFTAHEKLIIAILALLQFTVVLDFEVISPLGDVMRKIPPKVECSLTESGQSLIPLIRSITERDDEHEDRLPRVIQKIKPELLP